MGSPLPGDGSSVAGILARMIRNPQRQRGKPPASWLKLRLEMRGGLGKVPGLFQERIAGGAFSSFG